MKIICFGDSNTNGYDVVILGIHFADSSEWKISTAYDGVHFTEKGHAAFASGIAKVLAELKEDRE